MKQSYLVLTKNSVRTDRKKKIRTTERKKKRSRTTEGMMFEPVYVSYDDHRELDGWMEWMDKKQKSKREKKKNATRRNVTSEIRTRVGHEG